MNMKLAAVAIGLASAWMTINPAIGATVNVTDTEVGVGLKYLIGFGNVVERDEVFVTSDGNHRPALALLGGYVEGYYPTNSGQWNSAGVDMRGSSSIAYDLTTGNPSFYGTSSANILFNGLEGRGGGGAHAFANQNYVFYEFEVLDSRVEYSVSFDNDVVGFLNLKTIGGGSVVNLGAGQNAQGFLEPGKYTLDTFLALSVGATEGGGSASNSFGMTFMDATLTVSAVPLPGAAWLFVSALLALGVVKRSSS